MTTSKPDLSKLSRTEKLRLLDAIEEKRRRALERREAYVPNDGQVTVHKSAAKVRAVFAGNGGGKTALGVNEAIWAALGYNPVADTKSVVPARVVVVLDKPEKVDSVWLPEIKKWFPLRQEQMHKRGKPYISALTFDNGSELVFMFHDQDPMSFESIELDFCVFDEPAPRHVYIALRRGGRKKGTKARYLIIGTPISAPWLRTDIYEPWSRGELPDTECFRYGTAVNKKNLADGYIESFSSVLTEKEKAIRLEGQFFDLDGLALAHLFKRDTHVIPPPRWPANWPTIVVIDPAMSKAHVAVLLGVTPEDRLIYLKELSYKGAPREFARRLKDFYNGFRVVDIVCDSLGSSELSGGDGVLSFIRVLQDEGVRVRATTYDEKQDEAFIQMVQDALAIPLEPDNFGKHLPRLQIADGNHGIIADIETVQWERYRNDDVYKPKLAISKKDYLACLKYGLAAQPRFSKGRERVIRGKTKGSLMAQERWRQNKAK
jgi:hypothetical protein